MDTQVFIIIVIIVLVGIFVSFYFSKKAIIKRKLKKATFRKISGFSNGETAKIVGKVEFVDQTLYAPLSNRPCALYHVHIEEKVSSGKSSHWKTLIEEFVKNKFVIREGKYVAFVDTNQIKSYIVQDRKYTSGFLNDATNKLEGYLRKHGHESEGFFGLNKSIRYKEGILEEGEEIAVLGKGTWKKGTEINLPDSYDKVLVFSSNSEEPVYLSDDPESIQGKYDRYRR